MLKRLKNIKFISYFDDLPIIIAIFMIGRGFYMIYPPLMWIIIGLFILWLNWPGKKVI